MKKVRTLLFVLMGFSILSALLIDAPLQAICCKGGVKATGSCGGDTVLRLISTSPTMTAAQCVTDTKDYYGVIIPCVFTSLDTTSPPCY